MKILQQFDWEAGMFCISILKFGREINQATFGNIFDVTDDLNFFNFS